MELKGARKVSRRPQTLFSLQLRRVVGEDRCDGSVTRPELVKTVLACLAMMDPFKAHSLLWQHSHFVSLPVPELLQSP